MPATTTVSANGDDTTENLNVQPKMVRRIANFVAASNSRHMDAEATGLMKRNILDSVACAISALGGDLVPAFRDQFAEYRSSELCTLIGGGRTSPDQAALFNSVLVRYVDLLDSYMAPGGLCHPSDNFGAILAAAEVADASGSQFMHALALSYEVQCRFTEVVPVMYRGLNHALQLSMSAAAGSARLFGLTAEQTANAIAIAAADNVSLACVHVEPVSHWKGISPGITCMRAIYAASLAKRGITGPSGLFEGPSGLNRLFDQDIKIDWTNPSLSAVKNTMLKKYCALVHGQPVIETVLALVVEHGLTAESISSVTAEVFQFAYEISGGGNFGDKSQPLTKEQADYNLKYLIAVALLDHQVGPPQLDVKRIQMPDVQELLGRVEIRPDDALTKRYPKEMPVRITFHLKDGRKLTREQGDYEGAVTRPLSWERVVEKFDWLVEPYAVAALRSQIVGAVANIKDIKITDLIRLLEKVNPSPTYPSTVPPV